MKCYCGKMMIRIEAHSHGTKRSHLGYYCPGCEALAGLDGLPLIPYKMIANLEQDPSLGILMNISPQHWREILKRALEMKVIGADLAPRLEKEMQDLDLTDPVGPVRS